MTRGRVIALVAVAAIAGYLVSLLAWPAPIVEQDVAVALVVDQPSEAAAAALTGQGFRVKVLEARESDPELPAGHVTWQDPPGGVRLPRGSVVTLTLSAGPAPVAVPDVAQFTLEDAERVLVAAGLVVGRVDSIPSRAERGVVVLTRPAAGTPRMARGAVDLVVSRGPADVRVPTVTGLAEVEARQRLELAGLLVGLVEQRRTGRGRAGMVIEQRPAAGTRTAHGNRVDLVILVKEP